MSERKMYVWRLEVTLPHDYQPGWHPLGWRGCFSWPDCEPGWGGVRVCRWFSWPRRRNFFDRYAAHSRAELLEEMGAQVEVIRSLPIQWEGQDAIPRHDKALEGLLGILMETEDDPYEYEADLETWRESGDHAHSPSCPSD